MTLIDRITAAQTPTMSTQGIAPKGVGFLHSVHEGIGCLRGTSRESLRVSPEMHRARGA